MCICEYGSNKQYRKKKLFWVISAIYQPSHDYQTFFWRRGTPNSNNKLTVEIPVPWGGIRKSLHLMRGSGHELYFRN